MIYTMKDLIKKAHHEASRLYEWFEIDGHTISLMDIWSHTGGRSKKLVSVSVDGNTIAPRCKRDTGLLKALNVLNALFD